MAQIDIYTTFMCPYCSRAKALLEKKGQSYNEIDVSYDAAKRDEMTQKAGGRRTVPQIWINGTHVGGSDDLYELERQGKLDAMLAA